MQIELHHTTWRYAQVFRRAGFQLSLEPQILLNRVSYKINWPSTRSIDGSRCFALDRWHSWCCTIFATQAQGISFGKNTADFTTMVNQYNGCDRFVWTRSERREGMLMLQNSDPSRIFLSMDHFNLEEEIVLMSQLKFMLYHGFSEYAFGWIVRLSAGYKCLGTDTYFIGICSIF